MGVTSIDRPSRAAFISVLLLSVGATLLASRAHAAQLLSSFGNCIDIQRGVTEDGTPVIQFHCHGSPNQNWVIAGGNLQGASGTCLDVMGSAPTEGAAIIVVQCNGRDSQKWQIIGGQIVGLGHKCLDIQGGSGGDGTPLILSTCKTSPSQQWTEQ
jgi:alpha-galactosidase